jgi:glycosyltransferase involved in cell wall biosynthesis
MSGSVLSEGRLASDARPKGPTPSLAVISAYKTYTGSTVTARAYYRAFQGLGLTPAWYQCVSSRRLAEWDMHGHVVRGTTLFRDDLNLVLNALFVFPRKLGTIPEQLAFLTDPILLGACPHLRRSVILVHDMREFDAHRRSWAATQVYRRLFRHLGRAARIVCVSNATRERLVAITHTAVPIDVIPTCAQLRGEPEAHLGASLRRLDEGRELRVLYVAADRPYKNIGLFCRLAKAMASDQGQARFEFVLVSKLGPATRRLVSSLGLPNLQVYHEVDDLRGLYERTDVLVHPSREEGYGLPVVEAMQFGIPILASHIPALRETLGEGGTLLPPEEAQPWVSALAQLANPAHLKEASRASAARAVEFSPDRFQQRVAASLSEWLP